MTKYSADEYEIRVATTEGGLASVAGGFQSRHQEQPERSSFGLFRNIQMTNQERACPSVNPFI